MPEHYDFHYQPTGSGAISGQQVLQQTEDAINELGDYVNDNVGGAMDVAQQALETAQNAEQDAQTALDTANSFSSAIQSAQQDASTALSTAQTAQTTAIQAQQDASSAVTTANNASGQVSTLSGTVTALGQRVTTAEGNITTLQNDVSIAQGNASSAMATAGTVKQQAFVFRYSSTALVASSTNSNALLDNTDNLKVGDKVIDSSGVLFSITAIDTQNSTFTIGTALIDLAQDSDVVHKSGDETVIGSKSFGVVQSFTGYPAIRLYSTDDDITVLPSSAQQRDIRFTDKNNNLIAYFIFQHRTDINEPFRTCWRQNRLDGTSNYYSVDFNNLGEFYPENNNAIKLGTSLKRWSEVYATNYYYGSNNVEFSDKFVTTDTNQTISGNKTFSSDLSISNTDTTANTPNLNLRNYKADRGTTDTAVQTIGFLDKNAKALTSIESRRVSNGNTATNILCYNTDDSNNTVSGGIAIIKSKTDTNFAPNADNAVTCGRSLAKWSDVQTYKVNALEPSSLSLPDLSNGIDISSYITDLTGNPNAYSPPANGYIILRSITANVLGIVENTTGMGSFSRGSNQVLAVNLPVVKNSSITIYAVCSSLSQAKFIPCQGNV